MSNEEVKTNRINGEVEGNSSDKNQGDVSRKKSKKGQVKEVREFRMKGYPYWTLSTICLALYDMITINVSYLIALLIEYDLDVMSIPSDQLSGWFKFVPYNTVICIVVYGLFKLYRSIWKYAGRRELVQGVAAGEITVIIHIIIMQIFFQSMHVAYYLLGMIFQVGFLVFARFSYRLVLYARTTNFLKHGKKRLKRAMLIGAGAAGKSILKDMQDMEDPSEYFHCIIDDNPAKIGNYINGVPVVGNRDTIIEYVKKYNIEKIYVALPSVDPKKRKEILDICKETGCEVKNLPSIYQNFGDEEVGVKQMKDVAVEDLLGRDPIVVNSEDILEMLRNRRVLVTGGGGSIGSELCRQIAAHEPSCLVIFDIYENNAYDIQQELKRKYPNLALFVIIGSVRDRGKVKAVFERFHPEYVYHAAAHKHVPLMEDSPCESIKNNVIGTYNTAYNAMTHGCKRFVLISTDKAVNPTNIMGASKRLCEMVIQAFDYMVKKGTPEAMPELFTRAIDWNAEWDYQKHGHRKIKTEFVAVRFGNVLGSNGSVIPLFKKQIEKGGPVTVTHKDIIRYFMTIPEAVSLVLTAGSYAKGGEIFVLDMGDPVKIDDLARNLIKLSGYTPDVDIKIEYVGLRPGEKLYEEKLMAEEGLQKTENKLIHIGNPIPFSIENFLVDLEKLEKMSYENDEEHIREYVQKVVSTYHPS